ncbi:trans-aconitate 2-methyltransferase [Streptacidiphilus sp. P02-A3a]|uniref:class I SAM-dependent methyltransferase n=1 Tax=Streptacidiphilus sp. P02-A3a TaxID=2704468 RepID=UPI0015FC73CF|nr:methyltransferase domain-containing protein [Streptacidiphilus sp. P02-A3a]QMU68346.1 class I SAM-dependent methyltransferase [Streptacidiphilus sp. P02-A3a]
MPRASQTVAQYWDTYKPSRGETLAAAPLVTGFEWTQHGPGHGPGADWLGSPQTALELGAAECKEAVHLVGQGVRVTALDFSAAQVERARAWWQNTPGLNIVHAEACDFLEATDIKYDAVYSVWGAVWFTDPERLFPLVRARLNPGGVFAFSHAEPLEGFYGPEGMYGNGFNGPRLTVVRWSYSPEQWSDLLKREGFTDIDAHVLSAPDPQDVATLMVRAYAPSPA